MDQKRALLVLGMHRSGTSATTRLVSWLGASLPTDVMRPAADNPTGFWESDTVVRINDAILTLYGARWDVPFRPPAGFADSSTVAALRKEAVSYLEAQFESSNLFVLKDPRMCQLVPFWLRVLGDAGVAASAVITLRSPGCVTKSLNRRSRMPKSGAANLYLSHLLQAERETRGMPRSFLVFDELLADPVRQARRIAHDLRLPLSDAPTDWSTCIEEFVDPGLVNHSASVDMLPVLSTPCWRARSLYRQLIAIANGEPLENATAYLDRMWQVLGATGDGTPGLPKSKAKSALGPAWREASKSTNSTAW